MPVQASSHDGLEEPPAPPPRPPQQQHNRSLSVDLHGKCIELSVSLTTSAVKQDKAM